jgi:hypothetical protein
MIVQSFVKIEELVQKLKGGKRHECRQLYPTPKVLLISVVGKGKAIPVTGHEGP